MAKNSILKRVTAMVLATVLTVNMLPVTAFAAEWDSTQLDVERNSAVSFTEIIDKLVTDKTTDVKVTVTEKVNGTDVSATVDKTTNENVAFFVGSTGSNTAESVVFATGGDYALVKGVGTASGKMTADAQAGYDRLKAEAEAADSETDAAQDAVNSANSAILSAQADAVLPGLAKNNAEDNYNDAVAAQTEAQTAYDNAVAALDNTAAAVEAKKAELAAEEAALAEEEAKLEGYRQNLSSTLASYGYASTAELEANVANLQAQYDAAGWRDKITIGLKLTAAKTALTVVQGIENSIANSQAEVDAKQEAVNAKQAELDAMDEEAVKAMLQQDIDNAAAVLETAKAATAQAKTELDSATATYDAAQQKIADAQAVKAEKEAILSEKQAAEADRWQVAADYITALTADMVEFTPADVSYTAGTESYAFSVKVYDRLTVNVVDEMGSMSSLPQVSANAQAIAENVYRIYENGTVNLTVPNVTKYRFSVDGAESSGNSYTVASVNAAATVTVTYTEIGASSVTFTNPTGAVITVNDGSKDLVSGENTKAGTQLTVTATAETGWTVTGVKVTDKNGAEIPLTDGKFTTSVVEEDAYTITATTQFTGSVVTVGEKGSYVEDVLLTVDDTAYTAGSTIAAGGMTVTVRPVMKAGFVIDEMTVLVLEGEDTPAVTAENGVFTFTVKSGCKYEVSFSDEAIEDIRNKVVVQPADGATITVTAGGKTIKVPGNTDTQLAEIVPGEKISVTITPDKDNTFISSYAVTAQEAVAVNDAKTADGTVTFSFTAGTLTEYTVSAQVSSPVVAASGESVVMNKFDVVKMHKGVEGAREKLEADLWKAFTTAADITVADVEFQYVAGQADLSRLGMGMVDIWLPIDVEEVSVDSIATVLSETLNISASTIKWVLNLIGTDSLLAGIKGFAEEDGEITVKAVYSGNVYTDSQATAVIAVQDLRTATELVLANPVNGFVYGNFTPEQVLAAAMADGGLMAEGEKLADEYQAMVTITMENVNAGERTAVISFPGDDDYKNSKAEIVVNVEKADAAIKMTTNNVILYQNMGLVTKDYLMTITPDVQIEDEVGHISFFVGLDLKLKDAMTEGFAPELVATVDLSGLKSVTIGGIELPASDTAINTLIRMLDPDGDGLTLSELLESLGGLGGLDGLMPTAEGDEQLNTDAIGSAISQLYNLIQEYIQYADIRIRLVNDEQAIVPASHGVYLMGAVTTDTNYNTAANATYLIITANPVKVEFDGENRQFVYDGQPKALPATAYDADGNVVPGTMTIIYAGILSDGTTHISTEAPVHTGAYTVTALFADDNVCNAGFAVDAMVIWPNNEARVDVLLDTEDQYLRTYTGTEFNVWDMISLPPAGTDAEVAVITAAVEYTGQSDAEGWSAVNNNVNIDLPATAEKLLGRYLPLESGLTKAQLVAKAQQLKATVAEYGFDTEMVDQILNVLADLPDNTTVTFKDNVSPVNSGVYLIAAVVLDPDYVPAMDAGLLLIAPAFDEEVLVWNYNDTNGIFTQPALDLVDMGAKATIDESNTAKIKYAFIGLDKTGTVSVNTADGATLADTAKALHNGAFMQVAYFVEGYSNVITLAQPIARTFAVVPQLAEVVFPDCADNTATFTYTGSAIDMPVEVVKADGSAAKAECLTVRYTGIDRYGKVYDSLKAPVNAGTYKVTAAYVEYDANGSTKYVAFNAGTLVILPAQAMVAVKDTFTTCDDSCLCDCVSYSETVCDENTVCDCHKVTVAEREMIDMTAGQLLITVTQNANGKVNVILPAEWSAETAEISAEELVMGLEAAEKSPYLADLAKVLKELLKETGAETVSINGEELYVCGTHTVWAIAFGANYLPAISKADMTTDCYDPFSGTFGDNITWYLDKDGVLHIEGSGDMDNDIVDGNAENIPWYRVKDLIKSVEIEDGITSVADYAFEGCEDIESFDIPDSITAIGDNAFSGCTAIEKLKLPADLETIGAGAFENCTEIEYIQIYEGVTFIDPTAFDGTDKDIPVYIYFNDYAVEELTAQGFTNIIVVDYDNAEIIFDREHLIVQVGTVDTIHAKTTYPVELTWYVEGDAVTVEGNGYDATFTAVQQGTAYVVASAQFGDRTVYQRCRIDVTETVPAENIRGVHLPITTVTSNIYSRNYASVNIHFDIVQNMMSFNSLTDRVTETNNGVAVEKAYFTNEKANELFELRVVDDRTLAVIPVMDVNDAKVVKSVKGSYKTKITVVVDGQEFTTTENLTLKTSKKLPTVKAKSVKLNSFYTESTMPLVFTGKNINVVGAEINQAKATKKTPAIPAWAKLNDDMTVSYVSGGKTKASGKMYLNVMLADYTVPVKVTANISVASTAPKLKLSSTKATFNKDRTFTQATEISLLSANKKVAFGTIGVTDVKVADLTTLSAKDQKTYKASANYVVTDYNPETGLISIDLAPGKEAVSGKIRLEAYIAGSVTPVRLTLIATVHSKTPVLKVSASSVSLYTAYSAAHSTKQVTLKVTPADYVLDTSNLSWTITDTKGRALAADTLDVAFADGVATISANSTTAVGKYKVVFSLENAAKAAAVTVTVKAPSVKLPCSKIYLNKTLDESRTLTLKTTPADYKLSAENLSWTITDSKGKAVDSNVLDISLNDKALTLGVNENTPYGKSFRVVLKMAETGKTVTLKVDTRAETKSVAKAALSVSGKLQSGFIDKPATIKVTWTNLTAGADISANIRVYATAKAKGSQPVDVTDRFVITHVTNSKYTLQFKDLESMNTLNPTDKYTVAVKGAEINNVQLADSKAVKVTFSLTKPSVKLTPNKVTLYKNDRFSRGEFKLSLKNSALPDVAYVKLVDSKVAKYYQLVDLGDGEYALEYKDNLIDKKVKSGTVKLQVYLEGNNPEFNKPNTTVNVKITNKQFKTK